MPQHVLVGCNLRHGRKRANVQAIRLGKRDFIHVGNVLQVDHVVRRDQVVTQADDDVRRARHKDRFVVVLELERGGFLQ